MTQPVTQPVPAPVLHFFAGFLENPDDEGLGHFQIELLKLELDRADHIVPPERFGLARNEVPVEYIATITESRRVLKLARGRNGMNAAHLDLRYYWLTLLGYRLAIERGLSEVGLQALRRIACTRLGLSLNEAETWSGEMLFRQYTETVLRDEWDYPGTGFRGPGNAVPREAV